MNTAARPAAPRGSNGSFLPYDPAVPSARAKVLVTGGAGFIGSHLVERLLADGHEVRVLDNFATGRRENLSGLIDEIELIEGDIQSYERVHNAIRGTELVFHAAALPSVPRSIQDPLTSTSVNVTGTLNTLLSARDEGVRRVIYASSSSIYGANPELPKTTRMLPAPISPYAVAKLAGEGLCRSFTEVFELETVSLRYFNVFGPRQDPLSAYAAVIPRFIAAFLDQTPPPVYGDGTQSRDFTYVDNAIDATMLAADAEGVAGETFNVACGERTSLNELLDELRAVSGHPIDARYTEPRPGDVRHSLADIGATRERLGYEPAVDVRTGVKRTFEGQLERHPDPAQVPPPPRGPATSSASTATYSRLR
jgi:nucleoside-diphosphate-sugar epimerase